MDTGKNVFNKIGSALVLLIGLLAFLTIIVGGLVRMTVYGVDVLQYRKKYIEAFYAVEGLVLVGIKWCKENHDIFTKHTMNECILFEGPWLNKYNDEWQGKIVLICTNVDIHICGFLYKNDNLIATQGCYVAFNKEHFLVTRWHF